MTLLPQTADLRAEAEEFDRLLSGLEAADWARATQFKAWLVEDIVRHLHAGDLLALASATGPDAFGRMFDESQALRAQGKSRREVERLRIGSDDTGEALRRRWRSTLERLCDALAGKPADARLRWAGPDMGLRMFTTARQMEVWSHAQAIYDLKGKDRPAPSPRLRNVAEIGVRTFGWTFSVHGLPVPASVPHVRLAGPQNETWEWHAGNADDHISGDAVAFCQVVTQTRNIGDTGLSVKGDVARRWMRIAQCFAGPPETPPAEGARFRAPYRERLAKQPDV
jgi:uncharacterized protein (TIGR03084 family)